VAEKSTKAERELRNHLRALALRVNYFLAALESEMLQKSTARRGGNIAKLSNDLEMQNDLALRFGLGLERRGGKIMKVKR